MSTQAFHVCAGADDTLHSLSPLCPCRLSFFQCLGIGLLITLFQIALLWPLAPDRTFTGFYANLNNWDGGIFASVVTQGYFCDVDKLFSGKKEDYGNAGMFPGYPLASKAVMALTGLPVALALPVTAQLACWGFWTYFLLLLNRWGLTKGRAWIGILAILCYPSSFFLVTAYSESLFLMAMTGFLFWSESKCPGSWLLAAVHGVVTTGTRIVGAAVVVYPLLAAFIAQPSAWRQPKSWFKSFGPGFLLAITSGVGMLAFFTYSHCRFGYWNLYEHVQRVGWNTQADYLAIFKVRSYCPPSPFYHGSLDPPRFDRWFPPFLLVLAGMMLTRDFKNKTLGPLASPRAALYGCAALMFYLVIAAKASVKMGSLIRISLPIYLLLLLAGLPLYCPTSTKLSWTRILALILALFGFLAQLYFGYRFTRSIWVA